MTNEEEELRAAEMAKEALSAQDISPTTLRNTKDTAVRAMSVFPDEASLNDARHTVGLALYELIQTLKDNPAPQEKIEKARGAVDEWINQLRAA
jgi:hypothetical protein